MSAFFAALWKGEVGLRCFLVALPNETLIPGPAAPPRSLQANRAAVGKDKFRVMWGDEKGRYERKYLGPSGAKARDMFFAGQNNEDTVVCLVFEDVRLRGKWVRDGYDAVLEKINEVA